MTLSLIPSRISPWRRFSRANSSSINGILTRRRQLSSSNSRFLLICRVSSSGDETAARKSLEEDLLRKIAGSRDADQVLDVILQYRGGSIGVVEADLCFSIIEAALDRNNTDLALSVFTAMRSSSVLGPSIGSDGSYVEGFKWGSPDVRIYNLLVCGLARTLKVSDALRIITNVSRPGVYSEEEMPFGKIVNCPTCAVPITVVQPQNGTQVASCSKCRYQYELVSGEIVSIDSEELRMCSCRTQRRIFSLAKWFEVSAIN